MSVVVSVNRFELYPQEIGKRSQMWRMTMIGMLAHEGTTSPREPSYSSRRVSSQSTSSTYVLDIQAPAFSPDKEQPLVLRKPDESRRTTQHWSFTNVSTCMSHVYNDIFTQSGMLYPPSHF